MKNSVASCFWDVINNQIKSTLLHNVLCRVLFHCMAGVSRSASLCIYAVMRHNKSTLKEAYELTIAGRSCIYPNQSFGQQVCYRRPNITHPIAQSADTRYKINKVYSHLTYVVCFYVFVQLSLDVGRRTRTVRFQFSDPKRNEIACSGGYFRRRPLQGQAQRK